MKALIRKERRALAQHFREKGVTASPDDVLDAERVLIEAPLSSVSQLVYEGQAPPLAAPRRRRAAAR